VTAVSHCVDGLVAQGPEAGGHRGTYDPPAVPSAETLDHRVTALVERFECPVVAVGSLGTSRDVRRLRDAGVAAVQLGTAFLLADEAGTNPVHRAALRDPNFAQTVVTRADTGRYARALRNRFIDEHEADAVFGFPEVAKMIAPLQAAALKVSDRTASPCGQVQGFVPQRLVRPLTTCTRWRPDSADGDLHKEASCNEDSSTTVVF
jgi:nitronate monooxygenase